MDGGPTPGPIETAVEAGIGDKHGHDLTQRLAGSDAWGALRVVRELAGGYRNEAVLVERGSRLLVAKSSRRSEAALAWLDAVHVRARDVGIEVPELVRSHRGRLVEDGITLERFIVGRQADAGGMARLRGLLRALHDATRSTEQRPGFISTLRLLHEPSGGDVDLGSMPEDVVRACRAAWSHLGEPAVSVVHGDLHPGNILETEDGGIALIDWDEARVDASLLDEVALSLALGARPRPGWEPAELALRAWEVANAWQVEPDYARRLAAHLPPATDLA